MIVFIYGTTGELIKIAPVMRRLQERGIAFRQWTTGQQAPQLAPLGKHLGLPPIDRFLANGANGEDLRTIRDLPRWFLGLVWTFLRTYPSLRRELRSGTSLPVIVVHGDTMTTPLAALGGRVLGAQVAHVEAGPRSFDLRHPFPEELNRRVTSRIVHVHYAPGSWCVGNLGARANIVDTINNTLRDSIELAADASRFQVTEPFGIISLHRQELLGNHELLRDTMRLLFEVAKSKRMLFIEHTITIEALRGAGIYEEYTSSDLVQQARVPYIEFTQMLKECEFLFTDSGGGQQETYYLDVPCLIHRMKTETQEGLDENVLLSHYDLDVARDFLRDPSRYRRSADLPDARPSDIIVDDMTTRGWLGA